MARSAVATLALALTFLLIPPACPAQSSGSPGDGTRVDTLVVSDEPLRLSSFIVPGSESVRRNGVELDAAAFELDFRHGTLTLRGSELATGDTLIVRYSRFPFAFKDVYRRYEPATVDGDSTEAYASAAPPPEPMSANARIDPFGNFRLQRSGSITRGIITGNRRDVSVESGLRMQLSGEVAQGVHVNALLTDENTPIQPEGVTRRLNEFDRVSISIENAWGRAELGDFNLNLTDTRFSGFDRKLQGIGVSGALPEAGSGFFGGGHVTVAGATSRGIYQSHEIKPIDGVQGPYRLRGKEGERFIIVIAGTEVVYVDGRRLTRGATNDYTIDYQTGELTFTPRRLVTEDRRIQVEFQYTTVEFTRTVIGSRADLGFWQKTDGQSRIRLGTTFLREADSRDFGSEFGLTAADSMAVVAAGDGLAYRSGAEAVAFDAEAPFVQYRLQTLQNEDGGLDSFFVALQSAPADGESVYRVRFTEVGEGRGSYNRVGRSVNGLQYEYVGPGGGAYAPIRILPRPQQHRIVGFHGAAEILPYVDLFGEWAQSLNDQNRLSPLDSDDDVGGAYMAGIRLLPVPIRAGGRDLGRLSGMLSRQYTGATFSSFSRTRPVEFARRWNLLSRQVDPVGGVLSGGAERVDEVTLSYVPTERSSLRVEHGSIDLGRTFTGTRNAIVLDTREERLAELSAQIEHISSFDSLSAQDGSWLRSLGVLRKPVLNGRLTPGLEIEQERRAQHAAGADSLLPGSLAFVEYRPGVNWNATRLGAAAELAYRTERGWLGGSMRDAAKSWTWMTSVTMRPSPNLTSDASLGYRVRRFTEPFRIREARQNTESLVLRWNGRHTPLSRAIETDWFYEAMTERTPTMQEVFVETTPDYPEARYVWEDANGDGIIQVDEFVPEVTPNEGTYVRTLIPSDSLMSVVSVQSRLRLEIDPARYLSGNLTGWRRALTQVASRSVVEVQEKSRSAVLTPVYLLRPSHLLQPELTLNGRIRFQQDLFLFRRNPAYGLDLSFSNLRALNELASGRESHAFRTWRAEARYRLSEVFSGRLSGQIARNLLDSDAFSSRRYDLRTLSLEPELIVVPTRGLEFRLGAVGSRKRDRFFDRGADLLRVPFETRVMRARRLQVTGRLEVAHVAVDGEATGIARYELTDGRGPGTSYLWHVNGQYRLNEYLRASLAYDGRAPQEAPVLHTLRLQMSAIF